MQNIYNNYLNRLVIFIISEKDKKTIWKEIPDTDGMYFVSNKGEVLSLYRNLPQKLTPYKRGRYLAVKLKGKNYYIHKLVAQLFLTQPTAKHKEIHHIDTNTYNNNVSNLIYLTHQQHIDIHNKLRKEKRNNDIELLSTIH